MILTIDPLSSRFKLCSYKGVASDLKIAPWFCITTSREGCDLSAIEELLSLSPKDRANALKKAANQLTRARRLAKRI